MTTKSISSIQLDLNNFKLHLSLPGLDTVTLHFDTPSRRFYLSLMVLVVEGMKNGNSHTFVSMEDQMEVLALLNESVGQGAGSSEKMHLLPRIYRKWKGALPDLETAPLFRVVGRKKVYEDESRPVYRFDEKIKDAWANLFEYRGSREKVKLRLAVDKLGLEPRDVRVIYEDEGHDPDDTAWERFVNTLRSEDSVRLEKTADEATASEVNPREYRKGPLKKVLSEWQRWALLAFLILLGAGSLVPGLKSIMDNSRKSDAYPNDVQSATISESPTIAVLPFANLNADPREEYLCDGITEQIITALARSSKMRVIARNSCFTYKGKSVKVQEVARDLGVRYVLEGSVQKSGPRLRVTAQLIDAISGHHMWAESYQQNLKDLFSLQDYITKNIISALRVQLTDGETARIYGRETRNVEAYLKVMKGRQYVLRLGRHDNSAARKLYEEAISMDPDYARAYTALGWTYFHEASYCWTDKPAEAYEKAIDLALKAHSLNAKDSGALMLMAWVYAKTRHADKALAAGRKAISLEPNLSEACWAYGGALRLLGRYKEAIPWIEKGLRLDPIPPWWCQLNLAVCYFWLDDMKTAISLTQKGIERHPGMSGFHALMAMARLWNGESKEAIASIDRAMALQPAAPGWYISIRALALHADGKQNEALGLMEDLAKRTPDNADAQAFYGQLLGLSGRYEQTIRVAKKAVKHGSGPLIHMVMGMAYVMNNQYTEGIDELEKSVRLAPERLLSRLYLATALSLDGRMKEARSQISEVRRLKSDFSLKGFEKNGFNAYPSADRKRIMAALEAAGLK